MLSFSSRIWIKLKTAYSRITFTRCTLGLFLTTFALCFMQSLVQSLMFTVDNDYSSLITRILNTGNAPYTSQFAQLSRSHGVYHLELCTSLPNNNHGGNCTNVFDSSVSTTDGVTSNLATQVFQFPNASATNDEVTLFPGKVDSKTNIAEVTMNFPNGQNYTLTKQCLQTLIYPDQVLKNSRREELALIGAQFWLLFATTYALLAESVPHLLAAMFVRFCCTTWSAYAIWRTNDVQTRFQNLIIGDNTPCQADLFPSYLRRRQNFEGPDLFLGVLAIIACGAMSLKLMKIYKTKTFARIGTTEDIQRIYRFFTAVLACLQVALYFLVTSLSLWLDQLTQGALAHIATFSTVYKVQSAVELVLLLPWIALGWYALTTEHRVAAAGFVAWAVVMVICTAFDFYSVAFRWTFLQWPFFGSVTTASLIVLILAAGFASVCTARFGRGFANYLHAERVLASSDFASDAHVHSPSSAVDIEKAPLPWDLDTSAGAAFSPDSARREGLALPTYLRPFGQ